ncbi:hypothetical protein FAF44_02665 [Nonomuraea sp. MG754425]|uniref:hypothetical protein n=1 Tax=Nonomuraea sp. MG754425 TaxID=2570319 RepID=UPI001F4465B9|nr:hypothetical protein [Nonomuraea sp. MG754425]MCF6467316.1 hypothetical protein [Nonomuraea sp. MG754425]
MPDLTLWEELEMAANLCREIAAQTSGAPWRANGHNVDGPAGPVATAYQCYADAAWIAICDPGLAVPLADILERALLIREREVRAQDAGDYHAGCDGIVGEDCDCFEPAVAAAQYVLKKATGRG